MDAYKYAYEEEDDGEYLEILYEDETEEGSGWWEVAEWGHLFERSKYWTLLFRLWFFLS